MVDRLLILGGTAEAADLARRVAARFGEKVDLISSLAGRTGTVPDLPGRVRVGGFGGAAGLEEFLRAEKVTWVADATHPFAERISEHAYDACLRAGVFRLALRRPEWRRQAGDRWLEVDGLEQAAGVLPRFSRRCFLTVGPGGVGAFAGVAGVHFVVRLLAEPDAPLALPDHTVVTGRPPFGVDEETDLMREHRVDTLVARNSGGPTAAKLDAARALRLRMVLVRRPPVEPGPLAEGVGQVMEWLETQVTP